MGREIARTALIAVAALTASSVCLGQPQDETAGGHAMAGEGAMASAMDLMTDSLGLPMSREGSGTAWQPDSTPLYSQMWMTDSWMWMLHYRVSAGFDWQSGPRGGSQPLSTNWVMAMGEHLLAGGRLAGRLMVSLEPLTTGGPRGYPLLLQTGEEVDGVPLHDRQHPHDLFMEVALDYNHALADGLAFELYLAPSGEPALGPVAFPHRVSALSNPFAALGHHWQDSTHVSFGVVTAGVYSAHWKLEGSWFNGREPDQNRYDFDFRMLDSYAARLSFNPDARWSFQASYGYLNSPEQQAPQESEQRVTASANYNRPLANGNWATTLVFGHDQFSAEPSTSTALVESELQLGPDTAFGRVEWVQRAGSDLVLPASLNDAVFNAGVLELGYVRDFSLGPCVLGLGLVGSLDVVGARLSPFYGASVPLGGMVFLRLRPGPVVAGGSSSDAE